MKNCHLDTISDRFSSNLLVCVCVRVCVCVYVQNYQCARPSRGMLKQVHQYFEKI